LYKNVENHFNIAFPVNITNTGAVVHTVNFLLGLVYPVVEDSSEEKDNHTEIIEHEFIMLKNLTNFEPKDHEEAPLITSFAIGPKSSTVYVISFESTKTLYLDEGNYVFELCAHIDGSPAARELFMSFDFEISKETRKGLIEGNVHCISGYAIEDSLSENRKQFIFDFIKVLVKNLMLIATSILMILAGTLQDLKTVTPDGSLTILALISLILFCISVFLLIIMKQKKYIRKTEVKKNV